MRCILVVSTQNVSSPLGVTPQWANPLPLPTGGLPGWWSTGFHVRSGRGGQDVGIVQAPLPPLATDHGFQPPQTRWPLALLAPGHDRGWESGGDGLVNLAITPNGTAVTRITAAPHRGATPVPGAPRVWRVCWSRRRPWPSPFPMVVVWRNTPLNTCAVRLSGWRPSMNSSTGG